MGNKKTTITSLGSHSISVDYNCKLLILNDSQASFLSLSYTQHLNKIC